jgi:septal ring factor EnvC (AmiA/AmiB activator)
MPCAVARKRPSAATAHERRTDAIRTARLTNSERSLEALRTQLRSQSGDLDRLEAEIIDQRALLKDLHGEATRFQADLRENAQDLLHLASRLLAVSQSTGVALDTDTRDIFRRRGWTSAARKAETQEP